jgi:hypothetical protein
MSKDFLTSYTESRSYYNISRTALYLTTEFLNNRTCGKIYSFINESLKRKVVLVREHICRFGKITMEALRKLSGLNVGKTEDKITVCHGHVLLCF